ncbi:DUF2207 domain-containing protein [Kribbella sp. NPDC051770]|uniref:DUF2207 domain-containing protein n=1 Tax=Kribbella sp. NPDC051770 TaxID=3155413 RepID=UPI003429FAFE
MNSRRWWARALVVVAASCAALLAAPAPQVYAASSPTASEQVDAFTINYRVDRDGTVQVTETIVYRFGDRSDRHGIYRDLMVREPSGDHEDQRYDVSDVKVSSPTGADTTLKQEDVLLGSNRTKALRLRIGSPDNTVTGDTATYVIDYRLRGALRSFGDHDELYWNATGRHWDVPLHKVEVTVDVPGGVQRAACYAGGLGAKTPCERSAVADGRATYTQGTLTLGQQLTIVASINPGEVSNAVPIFEPRASMTTTGLLQTLGGILGLIVLATGGLLLFFRWNGRRTGTPVTEPPAISVAEARLLTHSIVDAEATQATLLELALLGAIRIENDDESDDNTVVLVDVAAATRDHHLALLKGLFPLLNPGTSIRLHRRARENRRLLDAQTAMIRALRAEVATKDWFAKLPSASRKPPVLGRKQRFIPIFLGVLGLALGAFVASRISLAISERPVDGLLVFAVLVIAAVALSVVRRTASRGRLAPAGRELVRDLRSLQRYLTKARAEDLTDRQLAELLPWAMVLDRGDRWEELIDGGDHVSVFSAAGMFRAGRFRRGVAVFMAGTLVGGSGTAYGADTWRYGGDTGGSDSGFGGGAGAGGGGGDGGGGSW